MKKAIFMVLVAVVLILSMGFVAVPLSADDETIEITFLPPLDISGIGNGHFKAGSTIPVKFLLECRGEPLIGATGYVCLCNEEGGEVGDRAEFRSCGGDGQYIANLKTKNISDGNYGITVVITTDANEPHKCSSAGFFRLREP